ncbi:LolA family protein [Arenibaculum pallidiluteum]|uniref:LolA family protein n=1 Tax=Arenibaculum pallidiluteum TaxID=2812559 RepID=UPI001A95B274|nr:outer membrane lipoprotein carrier protein LolA [Arenibaculum pallidiluteum]
MIATLLTRRLRAGLAAIALVGPMVLMPSIPAAQAAQTAQTALSEQDRADIARAEKALDGIRTLQARFIQTADNGGTAMGTAYVSRPGRMRLQYDPPVRDFIVSDGTFVYYWDDELKQQSNTTLGSTLADLILREDVKLSGAVTVTRVDRRPGVLEITVVETKEPGKGSLTLVFEDNPLQLRKWRVLDAQGLTTEVALQNPRYDVALDRSLFVFREPTGWGGPGN